MARRYNAGTNWAFERKQLQTDANFKKNPLTRVYKLEKQGKKAQEKDYIIVTHFQLTGKHENGQYEWFVDVITEISEKLREESGGQLLPVVSFNAGAKVPVPNGLEYDEKNSILDNHPSIKKALESCLDDVRNKLLQYDPIEQLEERIFKTRGQVTKKSMNESEITDLVKRIVRETIK